jgi:hypothetical protein
MVQLNRKFGLITGGTCIGIFAYQLIFKHRPLIYLGGAGCALVLVALAIPKILNPLRIVWHKIGLILGTINTYVILFIVFFVMVTPLGLLLRVFKRNLIALKWSKKDKTYWQQIEVTEPNYKQQF